MSPTIRYIVFVSILTLLSGGVHYYLWTRLVRDPALSGPWARVATALLVAMGICMFVGPMVGRMVGGESSRWWAAAAFSWMGALLLLLTLLGGGELARMAAGAWRKWASDPAPADPERRLLLARMLGGGAAAGAFGLSSVALASASRPPALVKVQVPLERLPKALDGLKIAQISDLHVSATIQRPYVEQVVRIVNETQADVVVLTGDLMDGSPGMLKDDFAPLAGLKSRFGSFVVTGNHEYYSGADRWIAHMRSMGMVVLRNERVSIGQDGAELDLVGIDDATAHRFGGDHGADLSKALKGADPERVKVLLAHQPKQIDDAVAHGVDLQLSGHTHGGQIWPWGWAVRLAQPYVAGLHKHAGKTWIYVSRGTGYWGPPMRLAARHEVTLITLRSAAG